MPPVEIATELHEFRLEVKEGLAKLDKGMRAMLERKDSDRNHLRSIMKARSRAAIISRAPHAIDATL